MMYSMTIFASLLGSALGFSSIPDAMKIPCSTPVTVTVTVKDTWCKESHPQDFVDDIGGDGPINGLFELGEKPGAHISPPVVYTHGASQTDELNAWGEYADQGVANIATTGNTDLFLQNHVGGLSYWSPASAVNPSLPAASCGAANPSGPQTSTNLVLDEQNTKISAIHMMAPSPDWFTGINAVDMCDQDGYWLATKTISTVPYDAGVDGGFSFRSSDAFYGPEDYNKIAQITCNQDVNVGLAFCDRVNYRVNPVAEFLIEVKGPLDTSQ